jgi:hypothetical protein
MKATNRREFLKTAAVGGVISAPTLRALLWSKEAAAEAGGTLTIAYNAAPPAWDPNAGPSAVSPGLSSIFRTLYDPYIVQREDLSLAPASATSSPGTPTRVRLRYECAKARPGMMDSRLRLRMWSGT